MRPSLLRRQWRLTACSFALALCGGAIACVGGDGGGVAADSVADRAVDVAATVGAAQVSAGLATDYPPRLQDTVWHWTFDSLPAGQPPSGFSFARTGRGRDGHWIVWAADDAPSGPHVLVQRDTDATSTRYPVAVADAPELRNLRVAVRCKPVSGRVDQACGLVFRYRDARNYYVARANPLENNVRLYRVRNGRRQELASWDGPVTRAAWHELRAEARGDQLRVFWDGTLVLAKQDRTFPNAGRVGLWTKADSYTLFDELTVVALEP